MESTTLRETILSCTDVRLLVPYLCQSYLLDMKDAPGTQDPNAFRTFLQSLSELTLHTSFAGCVRTSLEAHRDLGHEYLLSLLEKRPFADTETMDMSRVYRKRIQSNMTVYMDIDIPSLAPKLTELGLVTVKDYETLLPSMNSKWSRDSAAFELVRILDRKGPTAWYHFVGCLKNEDEHRTHKQLYDLVTREKESQRCHSCLGKRKVSHELDHSSDLAAPLSKQKLPSKLEIEEPLVGDEYTERRKRFESYYHNGYWDLVEKESKACVETGVPEVQAVGTLELALSWIFRRNKNKVLGLVNYARSLCQKIVSNNGTILLARCEYYLSLLYRYLQDYPTAEGHVREARSLLFGVDSSAKEDKSFAHYCSAIIAAEQLTDESPPYMFKKAEREFEKAMDHAHDAGNVEILVTHSRLQLARLYLGTTHTKLRPSKDPQRIAMARQCLESLKHVYKDLDTRCRSIFHLSMSDLHYSCGQVKEAIDTARKALGLAQEAELVLEIEAAEMRISVLSRET